METNLRNCNTLLALYDEIRENMRRNSAENTNLLDPTFFISNCNYKPVNHSNKYFAMWKYRLDFNLSYYVLFVNIGFVFCTLEHHCKQYDEIGCIDGTWILAQNG